MCTVICRWDRDARYPVQILALRDERRSRAFDPPGEWWPDQPGVVGGRDRQAGGSWCVSDVSTARTAVVVNRPERRVAAPGAPSRGVLPLLALTHRNAWPEQLDPTGLASFNLVLAEETGVTWWSFDGERLTRSSLPPGTHVITPAGLRTGPIDPRLAAEPRPLNGGPMPPPEAPTSTDQMWGSWLSVLREAVPSPDVGSLLVRRALPDGDSYQTVFGQFIAARPGTLRLDYLIDPVGGLKDGVGTAAWTTRHWGVHRSPDT